MGLQGQGARDPTRLAVVLALHDATRACVCDLAWITGRDEKLVSHHLRLLKAAGMARSERDGRMVMYELNVASGASAPRRDEPGGPRLSSFEAAARDARRRLRRRRPRERYAELARRVKLLSWLSLFWMTIEGAVAIVAGIVAGSIALIGFGLDSAIEGFASTVIIWRFAGSRVFSHAAEQRAQKLVALQFFVLAPYVGYESLDALLGSERADVSWVGIALAIGSVIFMPMLGIAKQRLADSMGSAATAGEGRQNMLCAYLAGALLIGLLGNALVGAWWLDPIVGP